MGVSLKQILKQMVVRRHTVLSCLGWSGGQGNGCGSFHPRQPTRWSGRKPKLCSDVCWWWYIMSLYVPPRIVCAKKVWGPNRLYTGPLLVYNWVRAKVTPGCGTARKYVAIFSQTSQGRWPYLLTLPSACIHIQYLHQGTCKGLPEEMH